MSENAPYWFLQCNSYILAEIINEITQNWNFCIFVTKRSCGDYRSIGNIENQIPHHLQKIWNDFKHFSCPKFYFYTKFHHEIYAKQQYGAFLNHFSHGGRAHFWTYRSDQVEFGDERRLKITFIDVLIDTHIVRNREITFSERYLEDNFGVEDFFRFVKENQGFLKEWFTT